MSLSIAPRLVDVSPVSLSYVAALRGVKPRLPETSFTYGRLRCRDVHGLICLAASNPDGQFYGIMPNVGEVAKAEAIARARHVKNITFIAELAFQLLAQKGDDDTLVPLLDYLVVDETDKTLTAEERASHIAVAGKYLKSSGLFAISYNAYTHEDDSLDFLVSEFAPEMDSTQAKDFLHELKALGSLYFDNHPLRRVVLDEAIAKGDPAVFFKTCNQNKPAASGTIDIMAFLLPRGFSFIGAADIGANYRELSAPESAHSLLSTCEEHVLYEPIKDFAMNRLVRHDVWCRLPVEQTEDPAALFGRFTFGVTSLKDRQPSSLKVHGKTIDFQQPLMAKMLDVMTTIPMGIGDFLQHPKGKGAKAADVLAALHMLVATGVVRPMRGHYQATPGTNLDQLKWATEFNRYLNDTPITDSSVLLASQIVGCGIMVPARDALVMQAINRVGLANSVDALLLELMRVANDPALASQIMDTAEPTPESAHNMVNDVVQQSIVHWYAYGLLAA